MTKQQKIMAPGSTGGAATARAIEPIAEPHRPTEVVGEATASDSPPEPEQIARLAYSYWQARGCPEGSPEQDWLRAEAELRTPLAGTRA